MIHTHTNKYRKWILRPHHYKNLEEKKVYRETAKKREKLEKSKINILEKFETERKIQVFFFTV